ncbi:MAG: hypothetical protein Q8Q29_03665 [Actinomycetota bacterium]|nr:hypothetical protein [Actinomycetota bacterium]
MTELTLAEAPYPLRVASGTADNVVARLEDLLELRDRARIRGYRDLAEAYTDRIVAEVWPDTFGLNGPGGHAA